MMHQTITTIQTIPEYKLGTGNTITSGVVYTGDGATVTQSDLKTPLFSIHTRQFAFTPSNTETSPLFFYVAGQSVSSVQILMMTGQIT